MSSFQANILSSFWSDVEWDGSLRFAFRFRQMLPVVTLRGKIFQFCRSCSAGKLRWIATAPRELRSAQGLIADVVFRSSLQKDFRLFLLMWNERALEAMLLTWKERAKDRGAKMRILAQAGWV